jgi:hypothetical protein
MRIVGFRYRDLERLWRRDEVRAVAGSSSKSSRDVDRPRGSGEMVLNWRRFLAGG